MKTIFYLLMFLPSISRADGADMMRDQLLNFGNNKVGNGDCFDMKMVSARFGYTITKKWAAHHYELAGVVNYGITFHAILETKKTTFSSTGIPAGLMVKYMGTKDVEMENGFTTKIEQWKECDKTPAPVQKKSSPTVKVEGDDPYNACTGKCQSKFGDNKKDANGCYDECEKFRK